MNQIENNLISNGRDKSHNDQDETLRILLVEDSDLEVRQIERVLHTAGFDAITTCVQTEPQFRAALGEHWDIVLSDSRLPMFSGAEALRLLRQQGSTIPFIVVAGAIGEYAVADLLRGGISDFVMREHLQGLPDIIRREIREATRRRKEEEQRKAATTALHRFQQLGRTLIREIRRLDINYREYQIVELLIELSLGWGLESVIVPKLEIFSAFIGIAKSHVSANLANLIGMGIVSVEETDRGPRYHVTCNPANWKCRLKVSRAAVKEAINTLRVFNHLDGDDALSRELDTSFFEELDGTQILQKGVTESVIVHNVQNL
jgi:DNA-binding response OmpR family regulator